MRYLFLLLMLTMAISFKGVGQDMNAADKSKYFKAVKNAMDDSTKMMALMGLGYNVYSGNKPDSALYYYNLAYKIAVKLKSTPGLIKYYACYGDILSFRGMHYEALDMSLKAVALADKSKNDHFIGAAYNNLAGSYTDLSNIDQAYACYLKSIAAYERLNDKKHLAAVYANVLGIFFSVGHSPEKALEYGLKAIEVSRSINNTYALQEALLNVSAVYTNMGKLNKALALLKEAKAVSEKINDKISLLSVLVGYNNIFVLQNRYDELKNYTDEIVRLCKDTGNGRVLADAEYFYALYDFNKKNYPSAKDHLKKSLAISNQYKGVRIDQKVYSKLGDVELLTGNIAGYQNNRALEDSLRAKLHSDQMLKNSQELEAKYNVSKKEAEISNLNKEKKIRELTLQTRTIYIVVLTCALVVLLIIGWLVRNNSIRKERLLISERELKEQQIQTLEREKELLLTQALMEGQEAERSRLAKDLHDGLGGILTGTKYSLSSMKQNMIISADNAAAFEKTMNMLDQSISELRRVAHNMMPESLLKLSLDGAIEDYCHQVTNSGALKVIYQSFDIDKLVAEEAVKIAVYRIVQELINNAVKHASAKTAIVQITLKENILGITVEDDGKGFELANLSFADGMGYKNLKSRVDFLKGNIDVKSERGKGTSILIQLPV
ncbi:sensor histidine kinase [Mucilaginibacter sp. BJC16-A38]|uniref:tetratricopeptide repeat-containing sensor histidine kinase n=1 Tax=Mucilaginibacter phenanthrenivorans TaxID=1234842 RepID=UPI0021583BAD|nr:sensor histidine kinase [Mucilaginibacter phenanthrenivorans]MCR8558953.1 sensor histidine kinase [Mucilaginibacter phenanthrenivorans]